MGIRAHAVLHQDNGIYVTVYMKWTLVPQHRVRSWQEPYSTRYQQPQELSNEHENDRLLWSLRTYDEV